MKILAKFFSEILHPLLMPFYGILMMFYYSYLYILPLQYKWLVLGGVLLFTCIIPALCILLLYKTGKIKTIGLNHREDRPIPYAICLISYICCGILLYRLLLPPWVLGFVGGGLLSVITAALINIQWKISAHMTGIGGVLGTAFALASMQHTFPIHLFIGLILATGILGTSRIGLGCHTFMQVIAGTLNGFIWVFGCMILCAGIPVV